MKTETHGIQCFDGTHEVRLDIFKMDAIEAIDVYDCSPQFFQDGGFRIEGFVNGTPAGTLFFSGNLGSKYWGEDSSDVAREFLAQARQNGGLPAVPKP